MHLFNLFLALSMPAMAEDPNFEGTKEIETVEKPVSTLTAEAGGSWTTGNSEFFVVNAGLKGSYKFQRSQFGLSGGAVMGRGVADADASGSLSDDERDVGYIENARRFYVDGRYDWLLSDRDSLYALAGGFHDRFAGFDLRTHEQLGYSRKLIAKEATTLLGELGIDYAQENHVDGTYKDIIAGRAMAGFKHNFNQSVGFENTFEVYENILDTDDVRILNNASLVSALGEKFSLKLGHNLIFDNVPVEGFRKLDTGMQITFVASML